MHQMWLIVMATVFALGLSLPLLLWALKGTESAGQGMRVVAAYWSGLLTISLLVLAVETLTPLADSYDKTLTFEVRGWRSAPVPLE